MTESDRSSGGWEVKDEDLQRGTYTDRMHRRQSEGRTANDGGRDWGFWELVPSPHHYGYCLKKLLSPRIDFFF